jgi:hypothetical protein
VPPALGAASASARDQQESRDLRRPDTAQGAYRLDASYATHVSSGVALARARHPRLGLLKELIDCWFWSSCMHGRQMRSSSASSEALGKLLSRTGIRVQAVRASLVRNGVVAPRGTQNGRIIMMRSATLLMLLGYCLISHTASAAQSENCKLCRDDYQACVKAHTQGACKTNYDICMNHCRKK